MKVPMLPPSPPELDTDGFSLDEMAWQRLAVRDMNLSMPVRAARLDNLPREYRLGLPAEVNKARKQYIKFLKQ